MTLKLKLKRPQLKNLLVIAIFFCATMPTGIEYLLVNRFSKYNIFLAGIEILSVLLLISLKFKPQRYKITSVVIVFRLLMVIISFLNSEKTYFLVNLYKMIQIASICACIEFSALNLRLEKTLDCLLKLNFVYLIINSILMIIHPEGIFSVAIPTIDGQACRYVSYHFLGYRNYFGFQFIPLLGIIYWQRTNEKMKKRYLLLEGLIIFDTFLSQSSTSLVALTVFYLVLNLKVIARKLHIKSKNTIGNSLIFAGYLVATIVIVLLNGAEGIRNTVAGLFGKSADFTGRATIWYLAIELILKRPLFGYGRDDTIVMSGNYWYAHNGILDILMQGGIVLLLVYSYFIYKVYIKMKNYKGTQFYLVSVATTAGFCVLMLTESIVNSSILFYAFFAILGSVDLSVNADIECNK